MDVTFTPSQAYASPIWGAPSFRALTGKDITLDQPYLARDGQLSTAGKTVARITGALTPKALGQSAAVHVDRGGLRANLKQRMGSGLARGAAPLPALIAPTRIDEPWFDDINQRYHWQARDHSGAALTLSARQQYIEHLTHLHTQVPGAAALLILTSVAGDQVVHEPVTLLHQKGESITAINLDFQPAPQGKIITRAKEGLLRGLRRLRGQDAPRPQIGFAAQLLAHLAEQCRHLQPGALDRFARATEARQLLLLADRLQDLSDDPCPGNFLAAAYLSHEVILLAAFDP